MTVKYDYQDEPIVISKATTDRLLKEKKPVDLMALYWFYYQTAKWQGTNQPKASNAYAAKGLCLSEARIKQAAKKLIQLGLIARVKSIDSQTKRVTGHYIKVQFMWKSQGVEKPGGGKSHPVENHTPNALITNKLNALITNKDPFARQIPLFVKRFFIIQQKNHPTLIHKMSSSQIIQSVGVVDKLIRIDGFTPAVVFKAILWATEDSFWTRQILSCSGLRHKSKNGNTKFQNLLAGMEQDNTSAEQNGTHPRKIFRSRPDATPLGPEAQQLYDFTVSVLGNSIVRPQFVSLLVKDMAEYHNTIPAKAAYHLPWNKFFNDWLEFLQEKQPKFQLQTPNQLKIGGIRWNEFIHRCERCTQYSFRTGEFTP